MSKITLRVRADLTAGRMSFVSCAADWSLGSEPLGVRKYSNMVMKFTTQFGVFFDNLERLAFWYHSQNTDSQIQRLQPVAD